MHRLLLLFALAPSCTVAVEHAPTAPPQPVRAGLMAADSLFAAATAARGLDGWMSFYADDAVRLALGRQGIQGLDSVRQADAALFADSSARLVWHPTDAGAFADSLHGYTTGRSALVEKATGDTLGRGRYVTFWRWENGAWRVILDTGTSDS